MGDLECVRAGIAQAVQAAKSAPVVVAAAADDGTEFEGADRSDLRLPPVQSALVSTVAKANPHTVVVIQAGTLIAMPWIAQVSAILDPRNVQGRVTVTLPARKMVIAAHVAVTPETFSRTLRGLGDEGLIASAGDEVTIIDVETLDRSMH